MVGAVRQAHDLERLQAPLARLARRGVLVAVEHRQLHVLQGGGAGEQVEALEDEADLLVADIGEFVPVQLETSIPSSR